MKKGTGNRKSIRPMTMGESSSSREGNKTGGEEKKSEKHEGPVRTHTEIEEKEVEQEELMEALNDPSGAAEGGEVEKKKKDKEHKVHIREASKKPTKREVQEHEVLHERYEPWCRHCVRGRGRNRPH